jgi:hypothetical protein
MDQQGVRFPLLLILDREADPATRRETAAGA